MKRIFSGVKPSGSLTIGNYLGAIRNFAKLQHTAECLFCVVDLHALTVEQDPDDLRRNSLDVARLFVACGIDPEVATIFIQSHVPAHTELSWIMECNTTFGEASRMTQFKAQYEEKKSVSVGLFTYPSLMAADILLYQTDEVPVGDDQKQHLELTRDIAQRVNSRHGNIFKVPEPYIPPRSAGGRIMSITDPANKMAKSDENPSSYIALLDPPDVIRKKIRSAVTDSGRKIRYDEEEKAAVSNLMVIYSLCSGKSIDDVTQHFAGAGYGQFKNELAEVVVETLKPIQKRYEELCQPGIIESILEKGRQQAAELAAPTLKKFKGVLGLVPPFTQ